MIKKVLFTLILICNIALADAQQFTVKNLVGRWQNTREKDLNIVFFNDTAGAFLTNDGFLQNKIRFTSKAKGNVIALKTTNELSSAKPRYYAHYYKFINDSTLITRLVKTIPGNADTTNKDVHVYKRVKQELPGTAMRSHTTKDLLGVWTFAFKDTSDKFQLTFMDDSTVNYYNYRDGARKLKYVVDFTKQPITMELYKDGTLVEQGLLSFYSKSDLLVQFFYPNKRTDRFKTLMISKVKAHIPFKKVALPVNAGF